MLTLNARLLGSKVSLFQNVCVIGYCLFPLIVSSMFMGIAMLPNIIKFFVNIACVVWSIKCSMKPISYFMSDDKKWLVVAPIILFFLFLDWFVILI